MDVFITDEDVDDVIHLDADGSESDTSDDGNPDPDEGEDIGGKINATAAGRNPDANNCQPSSLIEVPDNSGQDEEEDDLLQEAVHVFTHHKQPVLCVRLTRNGKLAVTGGQDDVAHVWETHTGQIVFSSSDHKDSVHCVSFNCTDTFVATADMSGSIRVWKIDSREMIFDCEVDDIHWMRWHPISPAVLLVGTESGCVWMFNVLDVNKIKTLQGSGSGCTYGRVTGCGGKLMTGYEDGSLCLWDLKTCAILFSVRGNQAHKSAVTCIALQGEGQSICATGSTDGTVRMVNLTTGRVLNSFECGQGCESVDEEEEGGDVNSVEAVALCTAMPALATATVRGIIEVWDVSSFQRRSYSLHEGGISGIWWDLCDPLKVHSAGLDGCLNTWDGRDGKLVLRRYCHRDQVLDFDFVRGMSGYDDDVAATASEDTTCRIFYMNKY